MTTRLFNIENSSPRANLANCLSEVYGYTPGRGTESARGISRAFIRRPDLLRCDQRMVTLCIDRKSNLAGPSGVSIHSLIDSNINPCVWVFPAPQTSVDAASQLDETS